MRKLLFANCRYFSKNTLFWAEIISCVLLSLWVLFANYSNKVREPMNPLYLETPFFIVYQILSIIFAAGVSLMVGTEYSDGTIRNKLVVGYTRSEIYFSTLISIVGTSVAVIVTHGIVSYGIGYFLFGSFQFPITQIIIGIVCSLLANLVFTTLFVTIALNCANKSISAVVSIFSSIIIIYVANIVGQRLIEPEMTYNEVIISANNIQYGNLINNPAYVSGNIRKVFELIYDLLPSGQIMQIQSLNFAHWKYWIVFSVILFSVITFIGYTIFRKKDIK